MLVHGRYCNDGCAIMSCDGKTNGRSRLLFAALALAVIFSVGGCGDFVPAKSTGRESTRIIKEVRKATTAPEPNIPVPAIYRAPPKIVEQTVGGAAEFKLFYFCRQHTSEELRQLVHGQFASQLFDAKGKSTRVVDYSVSSNPATNQLIVRCPQREDAEAVLVFLQEVDIPPIQVKISCLVSEIYADKTLDWETTLQITDLLGEQIQAMPSGSPFAVGGSITPMFTDPSVLPAFPGASLREAARARMGLKVGYLSTSGKFSSVVDLLESQGYLKILMNPTLEVVNGRPAKVSSSQKVPIDKTFLRDISSGYGSYIERTEWENVVDSLEVTPHVFLDGSIGLETNVLLGSKLTPEGIKQVSIITKKEIDVKENRIRPGESLIIGGLRKSERRDVVRGIPFLKDIPLIGILFSGRDFEERAVETVFILTPTISTGGVPHKEMIEEVQEKHEMSGAEYSDSKDGFDPFGTKTRKKERQRELDKAREARIEAEAEIAIARSAVRQAELKAERAGAEAELARTIAEGVKADAAKKIAEAEAAKAEADAKAKAAEAAKAVADKATADAAKTKAEADKVKAEADAAKAEAAKIAADATKTKEEAQKAKAEADTKAKAAEQAIAQADAKAKAAEQAKAQADAKAEAAEQAKAEADAKAEAAEQARAEADAKAKAAEQAKAEAEKARPDEPEQPAEASSEAPVADSDKASPEPPEQDSVQPTAKAQAPAPEQNNADTETPAAEPSPKPQTQQPPADAGKPAPNVQANKPKGATEPSLELLALVLAVMTP